MEQVAQNKKAAKLRAKAEKAERKAAQKAQKKQKVAAARGAGKEQAQAQASGAVNAMEVRRRSERAGRFGAGNADGTVAKPLSQAALSITTYSGGNITKEDLYTAEPIVGTCENLEKSYFRLTSAPDPATVRPPHVLRKALDRALAMWREGKATYFYMQDQMKGMRQDLTVQHVKTELTVEVYEAHARMALEYGDVVDMNQCLSRLMDLYRSVPEEPSTSCRDEFYACRVLYEATVGNRGSFAMSPALRSAYMTAVARLRETRGCGTTSVEILHAMDSIRALRSGDYVRYVRLLRSAPHLSRKLLERKDVIESMRFTAAQAITAAYRPNVDLECVAMALGFADDDDDDDDDDDGSGGGEEEGGGGGGDNDDDKAIQIQLTVAWLEAHGAIVESGTTFLTKESAGKLFMPRDDEAVAHGDANLSCNDFLKSTLLQQ